MHLEDIFKILKSVRCLDMDYDSGRILGSMCTKPDEIGLRAYKMFIDSNLGDPGLFAGTTLLESEVIGMLGNLLHHPDCVGHIVTGGTEANLMAICVAKYKFQEKNPGKIPELILPRSAHFSFNKILNMLNLKPVYVNLDENYRIDTKHLEELINTNTMAIVAIAGTTELGYVDDIEVISEIAYENNIYLHVDAAFGGFVIPFLDKKIPFDFSCRGVSSITIDPHKMGCAPIPSGGILFRYHEDLKRLSVRTPYLTHDHQNTIVGTRSGASSAAIWTLLKYYGYEGYKNKVDKCMDVTWYAYDKLNKIDKVNIRIPELNLLSFTVEGIDTDTLQKKILKDYNFSVSVSEYPHAIRIVVMPHVKKVHVDEFIRSLEEILES